MQNFSIAKLDTDLGIFRTSGSWDPLSSRIELTSLDQLTMDGWSDASFWINEQEYENEIATILIAIKRHLALNQA